jgi:hypothetical protein
MNYFYVLLPLFMMGTSLLSGRSLLDALFDNLFWVIGFPLFGFVFIPWLGRWAIKRQLSSNPLLGGTQTFALRDEGLVMESQAGFTMIRWATLLRVVESAEHFLFYYTPQCAYFLPRAAVPTDELPAVRDRIRRSVNVPIAFQGEAPGAPV